MKVISFVLETQQPVLATSFQGDPNSDVSYSYIPGNMIRGGLIGRYIKRNGLESTDILKDSKIRRLFFDGSTCYLNAYPSSQKKQRTLPLPKSWFKDKSSILTKESNQMTVYDFSVAKEDEPESPKSVGKPFWTKEGGYVRLYEEKRRINIHNQRDRQLGRSVEGQGEIFRYDALDAGQSFQAVILCNDADLKTIQDLLEPADLWLGGSQSAGYGHSKVSQVWLHDSWDEVGILPAKRVNRKNLTITLLSDLILRNEWGQYVVMPPTQLLAEGLGVPLQLQVGGSYASSVMIGGFNRKWGLPLPQVPALAAGSVFVFDKVELTSEQIRSVEAEGIGERRVEGFGRIVVNWLEDESRFIVKLPDSSISFNQLQLHSSESRELATQMAKRLLRQRLDESLLDRIGRTNLEPNYMTNNQLSRLGIVARQALANNNREPIDSLLSNLTGNTRNQFERTKVGGKSFKEKITEWLTNPMSWISIPPPSVTIADVTLDMADQTQDLTKQLAMEYTLRLIMAVAKKATKEKIDD